MNFEIQQVMDRLKSIKIQHKKRACNSLAHSITKLAPDKLELDIRLRQYPTQLMYLFSVLNY